MAEMTLSLVFACSDASLSSFFLIARRVGGGKSREVNNALGRRMFS